MHARAWLCTRARVDTPRTTFMGLAQAAPPRCAAASPARCRRRCRLQAPTRAKSPPWLQVANSGHVPDRCRGHSARLGTLPVGGHAPIVLRQNRAQVPHPESVISHLTAQLLLAAEERKARHQRLALGPDSLVCRRSFFRWPQAAGGAPRFTAQKAQELEESACRNVNVSFCSSFHRETSELFTHQGKLVNNVYMYKKRQAKIGRHHALARFLVQSCSSCIGQA